MLTLSLKELEIIKDAIEEYQKVDSVTHLRETDIETLLIKVSLIIAVKTQIPEFQDK